MPKDLKLPRGALVVSCQAQPDEPLYGPQFMRAMAQAALVGGAKGIRANGPADVRAIREITPVPIIGINKQLVGNYIVITPTVEAALEVIEAGADIVAVDATRRERPDGLSGTEVIRRLKQMVDIPILADISTLGEGVRAVEAGADAVATTLAGYTEYSKSTEGPDVELVRALSRAVNVPIIAEGRISSPGDAIRCLEAGARAVVVGTAITRPQTITRRFVEEMGRWLEGTGATWAT